MAHQLAAVPGKLSLFPNKYVSRGPDRTQPAFNTLSLSEHIWGIFMIIREKRVPADIKPKLYKHIQDIIEDLCSFDWATAIRPWSEEIFSQVDQGRIQWSDTATIQMLRMSISRTATAKIDHSANTVPKNTQAYDRVDNKFRQPGQISSADVFKGGPPCKLYNSPQGCSLPSGHIVKGQRLIHVCKHCLLYTSAAHQHSEVQCRNKTKNGPHHF